MTCHIHITFIVAVRQKMGGLVLVLQLLKPDITVHFNIYQCGNHWMFLTLGI